MEPNKEPTPAPYDSGGTQSPSASPYQPQPSSQQSLTPTDPVVSSNAGRFPKKLLIPIVAIVILLAGAAAFYFGYYNNPSVIYSQSLSNTAKGYDKLVDYADKQLGKYSEGYSGSGSYSIKSSGFSTDGKVAYKSDGENSDLTFDVGAVATRVNADVRTIKGSGSTPDIYVKASGIKGLGTLMGTPALDSELAKLDDQWIVVDHTFIDNLTLAGAGQTGSGPDNTLPTREQVVDAARAFGVVNRQYLFSTDKTKAVTKIVKKVGAETIDGHKTYHYKVALQKDNAKAYVKAQKKALQDSKLGDWLKQNKYDKSVYASFDDAIKSADKIKDSDTYDVWVDTGQRVLYKVRFNYKDNPASNYVDVGLGYKGGSDYPFFIEGKAKTGGEPIIYSYKIDINTDTGETGFKFNYKSDGSEKSTVTGNFSLKPGGDSSKIEKPAKAKSISEVLSELGSSNLLTAGSTTSDAKSKTLNSTSGSGAATLLRNPLDQ